MTTYWQTWAAAGLADRQDNAIKRVAEFSVDRGLIFSWKPRKRLARNIERKVERRTLFFRRYPYGPLAPHLVGYSTVGRSRTGLERSLNDYLTSSNANLSTLVDKALDELRGKPVEGNDVVTNLDLEAQEVALEQLGTQCGAVVVLDPRTGKVRVMASSPSFDPNLVENDFGQIERIEADCRPAAPLLNRASAGLYVPGSTFKVITAAAALESKKFKPESSFVDPGYCTVYGKRVNNFDTSSPFGTVDLVTALTYSVNSVFCNIGKALGAKRILDTAKRFGFYERPPLETPTDERQASGLYQDGRLYYPKLDSDVDAGRMAFGQERMLVTPLQMAMVAGAIGVGGRLMEPQAVDKIVGPGGKILLRERPDPDPTSSEPRDRGRGGGDDATRRRHAARVPPRSFPDTRWAARPGRARRAFPERTRPGSSPSRAATRRARHSWRSRSCCRTSPAREARRRPRSPAP